MDAEKEKKAADPEIAAIDERYGRIWAITARWDRRFAWAFPLWVPFAVALGLPILGLFAALVFRGPVKMDIAAAMMGGWIAFCGAFTLTRPMVRGGFIRHYETTHNLDAGSFQPNLDETKENYEQFRDAIALQIFGPALIMAGTLLNGFSGLFQFLRM